MLRRITGLLLGASLTLLLADQGRCASHETPDSTAHQGVSVVMDTSTPHSDCADAPAAPSSCDHTSPGDCAAMSSCNAPAAEFPSAVGAAAPAHEQVVTRLVSAPASRVASVETPPPRA